MVQQENIFSQLHYIEWWRGAEMVDLQIGERIVSAGHCDTQPHTTLRKSSTTCPSATCCLLYYNAARNSRFRIMLETTVNFRYTLIGHWLTKLVGVSWGVILTRSRAQQWPGRQSRRRAYGGGGVTNNSDTSSLQSPDCGAVVVGV